MREIRAMDGNIKYGWPVEDKAAFELSGHE
jgi:hypothetical protein